MPFVILAHLEAVKLLINPSGLRVIFLDDYFRYFLSRWRYLAFIPSAADTGGVDLEDEIIKTMVPNGHPIIAPNDN
jgi:hypothetical protein